MASELMEREASSILQRVEFLKKEKETCTLTSMERDAQCVMRDVQKRKHSNASKVSNNLSVSNISIISKGQYEKDIFVDEGEEDMLIWSDEGSCNNDSNNISTSTNSGKNTHAQLKVDSSSGLQHCTDSFKKAEVRKIVMMDDSPNSIVDMCEKPKLPPRDPSRILRKNDSLSPRSSRSPRSPRSLRSPRSTTPTSYTAAAIFDNISILPQATKDHLKCIQPLRSLTDHPYDINLKVSKNIYPQIQVDNYINTVCGNVCGASVSEWTDDGETNVHTNENEAIHINATTKIEQIVENINFLESNLVTVTPQSQTIVRILHDLTGDLQTIVNDRKHKIDELESQVESQKIVIKSHQEESAFTLERIDHAMQELENTITFQHNQINELSQHSISQDKVAKTQTKEKSRLLDRITQLERSFAQSIRDKDLACEKVAQYEQHFLIRRDSNLTRRNDNLIRKDEDALYADINQLEVSLIQHKCDKELLLERIVNLEVELDDLMKIHKEEKGLLLDRINNLESSMNEAESFTDINNYKKSINNKRLSHEKNTMSQKTVDENNGGTNMLRQHMMAGMETMQKKGKELFAFASNETAINVIHNMLHKDKLTKLI